MRQIKFRAWDKESKKFYNNETFMGNYDDLYFKDVLDIFNTPGLIFEQFTGLLDKNGKEIYEGDIMRYKNVFMEVFFGTKHNIGFLVRYKNIWKKIAHKPQMAYKNLLWAAERAEVVSNIWEHPELLTKE